MKKILFITLMLSASTTFATIRTVSNHTPNPGQYTTINAAIAASINGDTVYVHPSVPGGYAGFTLNKELTIIGIGFEPQTTTPGGQVSGVNNSIISSNNSRIIGLFFTGGQYLSLLANVHDVSITRCWFDAGYLYLSPNVYNISIAENFFNQAGLAATAGAGTGHNILITNNAFLMAGGNRPLSTIAGFGNALVTNNIFYGQGSTPLIGAASANLTFSNNIFSRLSFANLSASTFSNNLTYQCTSNTPWIDNGTDVGVPALGTQNIANTSANFVNQANIDVAGYGGINWFVVNAGSPTLSSMAGDPDMGPYGGSGSYNFNKASASTLPYVYSLSIGNPTIQSGTNLNINVIGKKHD